MLSQYILIVVLVTHTSTVRPMTLVAEFNSHKSCEAVRTAIFERHNTAFSVQFHGCFPK